MTCLLLSGAADDNDRLLHSASWDSIKGLLLGITALSTRESR